ncbi:hypothetical protein CL689_03040 [Candidatus Saccharibacteria bacterium]|nr:hypothetical protein [Candidatus Saccharibacteria bacterium]
MLSQFFGRKKNKPEAIKIHHLDELLRRGTLTQSIKESGVDRSNLLLGETDTKPRRLVSIKRPVALVGPAGCGQIETLKLLTAQYVALGFPVVFFDCAGDKETKNEIITLASELKAAWSELYLVELGGRPALCADEDHIIASLLEKTNGPTLAYWGPQLGSWKKGSGELEWASMALFDLVDQRQLLNDADPNYVPDLLVVIANAYAMENLPEKQFLLDLLKLSSPSKTRFVYDMQDVNKKEMEKSEHTGTFCVYSCTHVDGANSAEQMEINSLMAGQVRVYESAARA